MKSATPGSVPAGSASPDLASSADGATRQLALDGLTMTDDDLMEEYLKLVAEDPGVRTQAIEAAAEQRRTQKLDSGGPPQNGAVNRRAPLNPFASPKLGKYRRMRGKAQKVKDPALRDNPLYGRLIVTLFTTYVLLFLFWQSLLYNKFFTGSFYASKSANGMIGPSGETLLRLGGLNANMIRIFGQHYRLFWAMWMHSGWIHVLLNILSQLQFFFMYEPDWGYFRTLLLFGISGLTGNMLSSVVNPCNTTVGSSGGLFGLMGAIIPYCLEYWHTIPRPGCILVFSLVVALISLLTGFTGNTDNFAHIGGFIGGTLFGMGTLTKFSACRRNKDLEEEAAPALTACQQHAKREAPAGAKHNNPPQKVVKRGKVARKFQQKLHPECSCRAPEWLARIASWIALGILWLICLLYLYDNYETYKPIGHVTFSGVEQCCCCYYTMTAEDLLVFSPGDASMVGQKVWYCQVCDVDFTGTSTWGDYCNAEKVTRGLAAELSAIVSSFDSTGDKGAARGLLDVSHQSSHAPGNWRDVLLEHLTDSDVELLRFPPPPAARVKQNYLEYLLENEPDADVSLKSYQSGKQVSTAPADETSLVDTVALLWQASRSPDVAARLNLTSLPADARWRRHDEDDSSLGRFYQWLKAYLDGGLVADRSETGNFLQKASSSDFTSSDRAAASVSDVADFRSGLKTKSNDEKLTVLLEKHDQLLQQYSRLEQIIANARPVASLPIRFNDWFANNRAYGTTTRLVQKYVLDYF